MLQPTVARRSELRAAPWDGSVVGAKAKDLEQRIKAHQKQKAMADMDRREVDDRGWELGGVEESKWSLPQKGRQQHGVPGLTSRFLVCLLKQV